MAQPSPFEVDAMLENMQNSGTMDSALKGLGIEPPAPEETETVEEAPVTEDTVEQEEEPQAEQPEEEEVEEVPEEEEEEEGLFLDLTPETELLLDKYGGDLNKALQALNESQSLIGRQGNELGDIRRELEAMRSDMQTRASQPALQWPDEDDLPEEAVPKLRRIAEAAFTNADAATFDNALSQWGEFDELGVETYKMLKATQVLALQQQDQTQTRDEPTLEAGVDSLVAKYPQLQTTEFQSELNVEIEKLPSLGRILRGEIPGVTPAERVVAFNELVERVAERRNSETRQLAARRVAVKTSQEARQARLDAQVAQSSQSQEVIEEKPSRQIRMADTKMVIDEDQTNAMLERVLGSSARIIDRGQ